MSLRIKVAYLDLTENECILELKKSPFEEFQITPELSEEYNKHSRFKGKQYKKCSVKFMDGKVIKYVIERNYDPKAFGNVVLISDEHYCIVTSLHQALLNFVTKK